MILFQKSRPGSERDLKAFAVDAMIESPVHPRIILEATERLLGLDEEVLVRKMERLDSIETEKEKMQHIKGSGGSARFPLRGGVAKDSDDGDSDYSDDSDDHDSDESLASFKERTELSPEQLENKALRYQAIAEKEFLPPFQRIGRERVASIEKEWRQRENDPEIREIDEERKAFVRALFKK